MWAETKTIIIIRDSTTLGQQIILINRNRIEKLLNKNDAKHRVDEYTRVTYIYIENYFIITVYSRRGQVSSVSAY